MVKVQTRKIRIPVEASKGVLKLVTQLEIRTESVNARIICAHSSSQAELLVKIEYEKHSIRCRLYEDGQFFSYLVLSMCVGFLIYNLQDIL
jgi:hypothetical protein